MKMATKRIRTSYGFTMVELMVVIALIAILAMLAAPVLSTYVSRSTLRALSTDFSLGLQRARLEAINRNMCVTMCMSSNAGLDSPKCTDSGDEWGIGWIVFLNPTCDTTITTANPKTIRNETVVLVRQTAGERYSIQNGDSGTRSVTFSARGNTRSTVGKSFNMSDTAIPSSSPDEKYNRTICLDMMGRVRTIESLTSCTGG
jgi:type IV fimbrial biogenesis protein FimT